MTRTFSAFVISREPERLQHELNVWFEKNRNISIESVTQSESVDDGQWSVTVTIIYRDYKSLN